MFVGNIVEGMDQERRLPPAHTKYAGLLAHVAFISFRCSKEIFREINEERPVSLSDFRDSSQENANKHL